MPSPTPTTRSVLGVLSRARLGELGRDLELDVSAHGTRDAALEAISAGSQLRFRDLLVRLGRDELRAACRAHGLDASHRARPALIASLLEAHGAHDSVAPPSRFKADAPARLTPRAGDIVLCRHRQWLVDRVEPRSDASDATVVKLVGLDDDNQGRALDVLWELELGARVHAPEAHGLGDAAGIDPPRWFGAYLHALKWSSVTATDGKLFQAPFRAGIKLNAYQLAPLKKALELPRANLFIADDVGLGKTIEAGLVLQELLLRQRVDFALIVCPSGVALQWRDEMARRFGLDFAIMSRAFVVRKKQERGFAVNPWTTHARFIVGYPILRRPEYREPLLQHLGDRARRSLLILDEAHTAAPSSASTRYAVDSRITHAARDVAERFENRLFLSATPHNGHTNSFSALLEMLDPQRFTRAIPVDPEARRTVMVRRLKEDLRQLGESFPKRRLERVVLEGDAYPEVLLSKQLAAYTELVRPAKGKGKLVFIQLQKRLLSSVEAFARTLELHSAAVKGGTAPIEVEATTVEEDEDEYGPGEDELWAREAHEASESSRAVTAGGRAREMLEAMEATARAHRAQPDAKALALLEWVKKHQCYAAAIGGAPKSATKAERAWSDTRVIVFTEYGDTKRWLKRLLTAAIEGTDRAAERILELHGGMSDDRRAEVQAAFNSAEHPVRILLATDAAREGVNLQDRCADLFHFDIPWNPARLEQRNGRIDRYGGAPVVRCHYFVYSGRTEDPVLEKLVHKVSVIKRELESLGAVIFERLDAAFARGIDAKTANEVDGADDLGDRAEVVREDLEAERDLARVRQEIDESGAILQNSQRIMDFDPPLLRDAIDVGLELSGVAKRLEPVTGLTGAWTLPPMPDGWQRTLDSLRDPPEPGEDLHAWRKRPLPPVTFTAPEKISDRRVHLHLSHPLVQRIMARFLSQGFSAHDLSRVTIVRSRHDHLARAIAFGRLSLFGPGATRLHDQLVSVAAKWLENKGSGHLVPFGDEADRKALERLEQLLAESPTLERISDSVQEKLRASARDDWKALWEPIRHEADALAHDAEAKLKARGRSEAGALRAILERQRAGIEAKLHAQTELPFGPEAQLEHEQWRSEKRHLEKRRQSIALEIESEPAVIEASYRVVLRRLEPVGLVYIWPETRG